MAATGYTPIYLYYSGTATHVPLAANLGAGELAINAADGNLFYKDTSNAVVTIPVLQSSATQSGWLSSTDWNTFNSKQPAGAYLTSVTSDAPLTGAGTSASHLSMPAATGSVNGYLTSTDWTTFNNKQPAGTYVTSVSGTAPVVSSGGTTPAISMAAATGSVNGYLTSTDWTTFNNKVSSQWTTSGSYIYYNTGNVGIGTAAPTVASGLGLVLNGGAGQTRLAFKNSTTGDAAGDGVQLALVSTGFIYQNRETGGYHSFEIDGVEYLQVASTGNINVPAGNVVIGTSGKGIDFSATAGTGTSELLADYEEGTWTPTVTSGSGSITTYVSAGKYTKIGRQVTLTWYVGVTDNGTGAGYIQVTGAPYSALVGNTAAYLYNQSNGKAGSGAILGTTLYMTDYAGAYPVATGQTINCAITYFV